MTFWECFWSLMPYVAGFVLAVGVAYPLTVIAAHKLLGGKKTVKELMREI